MRTSPRELLTLKTQLLPALQSQGFTVNTFRFDGYWNGLNTLEEYLQAQQALLREAWEKPVTSGGIPSVQYPIISGKQVIKGIWVGRNNIIHPNARLAAPVYIGTIAGLVIG